MTLKNRIGNAVLAGGVALTTISATAQTGNHCNTAPKTKGVYISLDGKWTVLQPISVSGYSTKDGLTMAKLAIPGAAVFGMNPKSLLLFKDPTAPVQITSASSAFCLVGQSDINPRDIQIVRLQVKKDHRELELAKGGLSSYKAGDIVPSQASAVSDALISVSLTGNLGPGQYILFAPPPGGMRPGIGGYDFSVAN